MFFDIGLLSLLTSLCHIALHIFSSGIFQVQKELGNHEREMVWVSGSFGAPDRALAGQPWLDYIRKLQKKLQNKLQYRLY